VQYDTPANLLYRPKDEFVEGFVGADRALKGLQLIRVKDVMTGSPLTAEAGESADAVRGRLEKAGADSVAVTDADRRFLGWASLEALKAAKGKTVSDVMSPSGTASDVNAVLNEALSLMLGSGFKTLPIVGGDNRLEGVLTFDAIQEALHEAIKTGGSG
jgi:osmoprotectant transport system ATP-binding protein